MMRGPGNKKEGCEIMRKEVSCLVLAVLFCMAIVLVADAVPQNVVMGPYNMSFDMGFDEPIIGKPITEKHIETLGGSEYVVYRFESFEDPAVMVIIEAYVGSTLLRPDVPCGYSTRIPREIDGSWSFVYEFLIRPGGGSDVCT